MKYIMNMIREWYKMIVLLNSSTEISIKGISEFEKDSRIGKASLS